MKALSRRGRFHLFLLLVWLAIGTGLRFTYLAAKPAWNDEFATLVFSLGNSFRPVPLDQAIALDTLVLPLQPQPESGVGDVIRHLMTESTHPPVYFVLTHLWLKLFPTADGLVSVWAARSLSAILGAASIPAMFGLGWLAFRCRLVGQIAAAMMAVSPYGIYQAQEARHYTLAILLIIASLCCLVIARRSLYRQVPLPAWIGLVWVGVNSLGIAVHYFFTLTLVAEALVLLALKWRHRSIVKGNSHTSQFLWWRIYAVAVGTLIGGLVWLPVWQGVPDHRVTQWIYDGKLLNNWPEAIARVIAWIITMVALLPVEGVTQLIAIASGLLLIIFILWALPIFICGLKIQLKRSHTQRETQALAGYVLVAIALVLGITYGLSADLTIAARYQFFYFPVVIVLLASTLAICWDASTTMKELGWSAKQKSLLYVLKARGKKAVAIILLMGLIGGITTVSNFAYQKPDRADLLIPIIQATSQEAPILIATAHKTHEQTGEMMALGLEFKQYRSLQPATDSSLNTPLFLLAHQEPNSSTSINVLERTLGQMPRPLDLWIVNFPHAKAAIEGQNCVANRSRPKLNGYKYQLFHCR